MRMPRLLLETPTPRPVTRNAGSRQPQAVREVGMRLPNDIEPPGRMGCVDLRQRCEGAGLRQKKGQGAGAKKHTLRRKQTIMAITINDAQRQSAHTASAVATILLAIAPIEKHSADCRGHT